MTDSEFLDKIEAFLIETKMGVSTLGMKVLGDPNFVREVRNGRSTSLANANRVVKFMEKYLREMAV